MCLFSSVIPTFKHLRYWHFSFLLDADVGRVEEELRHCEALIVHADDLLALGRRPPNRLVPPLHEAAPQRREVGQDVVARHGVLLRRPDYVGSF